MTDPAIFAWVLLAVGLTLVLLVKPEKMDEWDPFQMMAAALLLIMAVSCFVFIEIGITLGSSLGETARWLSRP